jgi:hypothetical protein
MAMADVLQINAPRGKAKTPAASRSAVKAARLNILNCAAEGRAQELASEDPAQMETLHREYYDHFLPEGPMECSLLEMIIHGERNIRRWRRVETRTLNLLMEARMAEGVPVDLALGAVFSDAYAWKVMDGIYSCQDFSHRTYTRSLTQLHRMQKARGAGK